MENNINLTKLKNNSNRSFIIPVLDYSPNSNYNIITLLEDLKDIPGNVIVIFNSKEISEKLTDHPRIDYYSVMSHNIGVPRAWNIGIDMVQTPVTFILNSDLHITEKSIETLENALINLENAACVGPMGAFNNFFSLEDHKLYTKGSFKTPVEIDAVSGFYFAVKTKYFHEGILKFENKFTPCYYEEWDMGLQIKKAGLKSYIVPANEYDHTFGGSIRSLKKINYFDKAITLDEIHKKNAAHFQNKWLKINSKLEKNGIYDLLISKTIKDQLDNIIFNRNLNDEEILNLLQSVILTYIDKKIPLYMLAKIFTKNNLQQIAVIFLQNALKIDPEFSDARQMLNELEN